MTRSPVADTVGRPHTKAAEITMYHYRPFPARRSSYTVSSQQEAPQVTESELTDPSIVQRIRNLLQKTDLNDWEKTFLSSINEYATVRNRITAGQYNSFKKIEDKFGDDAIVKRKEFDDKFTSDMRDNMKIVAKIYRETQSRYHTALVERVLSDDKFIPTEEQWDKFMNNKYAQGYVVNAKIAPKFKIGDTVSPSSLDKSGTWTTAIVIDNTTLVPLTHAAGGKRYSILPYGQAKPIVFEERQIKIHRS